MKNKLKAKVLGMWFKWQYACNSRLWVQLPLLPKPKNK
jgi:hypothetical protein